ncbi:glutamate/gamma-aminobutyrate family transporter YjeM [Bacillus sp. RG28]|uniref:Glutamate/gamma-aminobutyrate family transporter YjeM n=1 Tax=Gottfriedia endophytica TaxID=2820819 RepID=A0A940SL60_9BACI|nr:glutamate/gamma-aminobutyrate family transporter YjeM [Gottfriedia endophytica]MBP0725973.1 glutamate/gamma-aminobutyrate family transporter YjeM [Gottfriedia endophytica]
MDKKLSLVGLILIVFTSVFGFGNIPTAFYLMGYSAIPWYILAALTFIIPYAFMMAEYGAAFRHEEGGIYTWMSRSVGPQFAFIGTFMWFSSYVIWMVSVSSKVWIPFSTFVFGSDKTQNWSLLGLSSTQTIGLLALLWMAVVTFFASKGIEKISKVTSVGGIAVACLNLVLLVTSLIILFLNKGTFQQPISSNSFFHSPNAAYYSMLAVLSFVVFAIFAYGGTEAVGGLVDQTENAKRNFPKGITISAIIISIGYSLGILLCGIFANWQRDLNASTTNLGNITYVLMYDLGYGLGKALGSDSSTSITVGTWFARITGLSMFLAYTGAFFTLIYSPLKTIIKGTPKELWPEKLSKTNDIGMPVNAMWVQFFIVGIIIVLTSFGGQGASAFFNKLTLMTNVSMTLPYIFLAYAFIRFKSNTDIHKPFEVYKTRGAAVFSTFIVILVVGFANLFTIIQPAIEGDPSSTIWMIAGPLLFSIIAILIYSRSKNKIDKYEGIG